MSSDAPVNRVPHHKAVVCACKPVPVAAHTLLGSALDPRSDVQCRIGGGCGWLVGGLGVLLLLPMLANPKQRAIAMIKLEVPKTIDLEHAPMALLSR